MTTVVTAGLPHVSDTVPDNAVPGCAAANWSGLNETVIGVPKLYAKPVCCVELTVGASCPPVVTVKGIGESDDIAVIVAVGRAEPTAHEKDCDNPPEIVSFGALFVISKLMVST